MADYYTYGSCFFGGGMKPIRFHTRFHTQMQSCGFIPGFILIVLTLVSYPGFIPWFHTPVSYPGFIPRFHTQVSYAGFHTRAHALAHAYAHAHVHAHAHARVNARPRAHAHARARPHTHTRTDHENNPWRGHGGGAECSSFGFIPGFIPVSYQCNYKGTHGRPHVHRRFIVERLEAVGNLILALVSYPGFIPWFHTLVSYPGFIPGFIRMRFCWFHTRFHTGFIPNQVSYQFHTPKNNFCHIGF